MTSEKEKWLSIWVKSDGDYVSVGLQLESHVTGLSRSVPGNSLAVLSQTHNGVVKVCAINMHGKHYIMESIVDSHPVRAHTVHPLRASTG